MDFGCVLIGSLSMSEDEGGTLSVPLHEVLLNRQLSAVSVLLKTDAAEILYTISLYYLLIILYGLFFTEKSTAPCNLLSVKPQTCCGGT